MFKKFMLYYYIIIYCISQVSKLRREVTAVVQNADPWDSVVVLLKSEGGEVSSYGLAAAQLERIKV
jgi:serine protease SohB